MASRRLKTSFATAESVSRRDQENNLKKREGSVGVPTTSTILIFRGRPFEHTCEAENSPSRAADEFAQAGAERRPPGDGVLIREKAEKLGEHVATGSPPADRRTGSRPLIMESRGKCAETKVMKFRGSKEDLCNIQFV